MGPSRKSRRGSSQETSPNAKVKNSSKRLANTATSSAEDPLKADTKSTAKKNVTTVDTKNESKKEENASLQEVKRVTHATSPATSTANMMSPIRRSSRAPVPSSRFKDMEMGISSRKRSLASSQSEESDGDGEPAAKKKRKISDRGQTNISKQEDKAQTNTPEQKDKTRTNTPKEEDNARTNTPKQKDGAQTNTPKQKDSAQTSTAKQKNNAQTNTPKQKNSAHTNTPKQEDRTQTNNPKQKDKAQTSTPKQEDKAQRNMSKQNKTQKNKPKQEDKAETITVKQDKTRTNTAKSEDKAKSSIKKNKIEESNLNTVAHIKTEDRLGKSEEIEVSLTYQEAQMECGDEQIGGTAKEKKIEALHFQSKDSSVAESIENDNQIVIEDSSTLASNSVSVVEETVRTYMDEKDVVVVTKPETDAKDSPNDKKEFDENIISSEIVMKSHDVTLQEKDGQTVAIIKVPSNFGNHQSVSSETDNSSETGKENPPAVLTKVSAANKNRHGYILNKPIDDQSLITFAGQDNSAVVNVALDHATVKSVFKTKAETSASKPPAKTYGRVLKQESPVSAVVLKSPNHTYSLLPPQTIKAVSQTEGKTYSLLAPPSEIKQILKGANEKKCVSKGNDVPDSVQISELPSSSETIIIIANPPTSDSVTEIATTDCDTVSSVTADHGTLDRTSDTEQEVTKDISSSLTELSSKDATDSSAELKKEEDDKSIKKETTSDIADLNKPEIKKEDSAELVLGDTVSTDASKGGDEIAESENVSASLKDKDIGKVSNDIVIDGDGKNYQESTNIQQLTDAPTRNGGSREEIHGSSSERAPVEEVVVTSSEPSTVLKEEVESMDEDMPSPSVKILNTALAEAEKTQTSGTLKPQRIKLIENGVVYELQIFPEEEGKVSEEKDDRSLTVKQEITDEEDISSSDQDGKRFSSGTQTIYTNKRGRPKTSDKDKAEAPVHKLTTIVQEGGQKKHYYYVSVVPGKTLVGKYRHSLDQPLPGCTVNKLGEYCCKECDYKTDKRANFYKHRRLHTGAKPHLCPVCNYQARTSSNLKRHMGIHEDIREFKCNQCPMSFRQKIHLERHVRYRHEEKKVKCPMCEYVCANEQPDLKMHIKRKHTQECGKTYTCPECNLIVGSRKDLKQHLKFHKDGPELKLFCKECSFVTDCKSRLQRHLVVHSNVKPFHCGVCDYKATQKEHVLRHLRSQHKIEVNKPKRPWRKQSKTEPVETATGNPRGDFTCGDKIFACNHCVMRFAKLINLYKHLHTQHSDIMPVETEGNYFCVVCEFSTSSKKNLLVHMRRHNMTDQTPPTHVYSCVLCRYVNPRRRNLFQHMRKKHNIDISSQVDMAGMKEEEVNAVQEGVKVTELIHTDDGIYSQGSSGELNNTQVEGNNDNIVRIVASDLAAVANMIKIEDLTRTQVNAIEDPDDRSLVIDSTAVDEGSVSINHTSSFMQHKAADAIEGLQALAGQAGFVIEEEVQGADKQQTIVIEQQSGEVLNSAGSTTLSDEGIVISTNEGIVGEQIAIDGTGTEEISQIVEAEEALDSSNGLTSLELTEEQLSSLQHGDMVQMEGQVYLVEFSQDPESPDKQLLSFTPVSQE